MEPSVSRLESRESPADLAARVRELEEQRRQWAEDSAEDHTHLVACCLSAGIDRVKVEGDGHGVPGIGALADMLASRVRELEAKEWVCDGCLLTYCGPHPKPSPEGFTMCSHCMICPDSARVRELEAEVGRLKADYPGGDQDSQSRSWGEVWKACVKLGMLSFVGPSLLTGRGRVVEFINHLAAGRAKALTDATMAKIDAGADGPIQVGDCVTVRDGTRDWKVVGINGDIANIWRSDSMMGSVKLHELRRAGPRTADGEPVTEEWCEENGAKNKYKAAEDYKRKWYWTIPTPDGGGTHVVVSFRDDASWLGITGSWVVKNPTRGHVLRLLTALGLPATPTGEDR